MVYLPCLHVTGHIPFASGANVNIRFLLHNAVPHRKLVPTDRSMVYLPCLDITGHIPFASGANVNIRFFLHNAVLYRKLVPTDRPMVHFPCLDVTGHIPFASGANVNIRFFLHNAVLVYPTVYLSICLSLSLSISLPIYLSIHPSIHPPIHPSIHPSIYLSPSLCRTPQIGGVGGTRALAHSIHIQIHIHTRKSMQKHCERMLRPSLSTAFPVSLSIGTTCKGHPRTYIRICIR